MKFILDVLKGMVMGIANVIPGVSGGTMAVSMGIYDRLINALTHLFKEFKKSFAAVFPILLGMLLGIVGLSIVIEWMFGNIPIQTNLLFIGLILGGVPAVYGRVKGAKLRPYHIVGFTVFFAIVVGLSFIQHDTENAKAGNEKAANEVQIEYTDTEAATEEFALSPEVEEFEINAGSLVILFLIGVVASATMVIPGVSGSMMLMLLGYYTLIISSVSGLAKALAAGNIDTVVKLCMILVPFGIGVVIGIFAIAKIIEVLLRKFAVMTFWCIMGLIVGSPFAIVIVNREIFAGINVLSAITGIVALVIGCVIAYFLGSDKTKKEE